MPDTRKKYAIGKAIPGFKPGQPPYIVGPDKTLNGFTVHVNIDNMVNSGKWDRKVNRFHLSFKGINPQPVAKWSYNPGSDSFTFQGWANKHELGLDAIGMAALLVKVNSMMNGVQKTFGGTISPAT